MYYYSEQAEQETSSNTFSFLLANHLPICVFLEVKCNKIGQCTPNVQLLLLSPPQNFGNEALNFALAIVTSY